jgi:GNAT superfamily N-acetyltransferase
MIIQSLTSLPSLKPLRALARQCEIADGYPVKLYWNLLETRRHDPRAFDYLYLPDKQFRPKPIGLLSIYYFQDGVEITAMVDPNHRYQGIFTTLMKNALKILQAYSVPSYMLACHAKAESLNAKCAARGGKLDHSEIEMQGPKHLTSPAKRVIKFQPADIGDMKLLIEIHQACFPESSLASIKVRLKSMLEEPNRYTWIAVNETGTPVGKIHMRVDETVIFLHDLGIIPAFQNQGYGTSLIYTWYQQYNSQEEKPILIDVLGDNTVAIRLYANCGFTITSEYNFWRFPLK